MPCTPCQSGVIFALEDSMKLLLVAPLALIFSSGVPARAQFSSKSSLRFVGTTTIAGGPAGQLPPGGLFVQHGLDVNVSFEIPGVSGNNAPARLPAAAVPMPAGNSIVTGSFVGFGGLTQFLQAIAPTGVHNGFNFQLEPPDQGQLQDHRPQRGSRDGSRKMGGRYRENPG